MTRDELRAAATEVVAWCSDTPEAALNAEVLAVCRAYLAEHPADDGEAVTEERLLALPGARKPSPDYSRIRVVGEGVALDLFPWSGGYSAEFREVTEAGDCGGRVGLPGGVRTMGDVYRLVAILSPSEG
jgi:hypothetical protein